MKTLSKRIILTFLFIVLFLNGCEIMEESFNYIVVTVQLNVSVDGGTPGMEVKMAIQKAGGEITEEVGSLGDGLTTSLTGVFNVYKEQPVEIRARLVEYPDEVYWERLIWETIESNAKTPDDKSPRTYLWVKNVTLYVPD